MTVFAVQQNAVFSSLRFNLFFPFLFFVAVMRPQFDDQAELPSMSAALQCTILKKNTLFEKNNLYWLNIFWISCVFLVTFFSFPFFHVLYDYCKNKSVRGFGVCLKIKTQIDEKKLTKKNKVKVSTIFSWKKAEYFLD